MRLARRDPHLQDLGELGPRLDGEIDAIQIGERLRVGWFDAEDVLVRLLGLGDVPELILERLCEPLPDGTLHLGLDMQPEHIRVGVRERLSPAITISGKPGASSPDFAERELLECLYVRAERPNRIEQLVFLELCDPVVRLEPLFLVVDVL